MNYLKNKKGSGVVGNVIGGVGGLVILVVVILLVVSTIINAGLLTSADQQTANNLSANLSAGINKVALQVPTIMNIAVIVILIGLVVFLYQRSKPAISGTGGSL